jgi:hypothetical protein
MIFFKKYPQKDFTTILDNAQIGDFILYHNMRPDFIGDGIEWFTHKIGKDNQASHVDLYVGLGDVIGYTIGGCKKMRIDRYFKNHMKIYLLRIPDITPKQQQDILKVAHEDLADKRPYDYVAYLGFVMMCGMYKLGLKSVFEKDNPLQGAGKVCSTGGDRWALVGAQYDIFPGTGEESVTPNHYFDAARKGKLGIMSIV